MRARERFARSRVRPRLRVRVTARKGAHNSARLTQWPLTRSNVRLFSGRRPEAPTPGPAPPRGRSSYEGPGRSHETHISTLEASPRSEARFSQPDANGRRTQSPVGAPRQGPRAAFRLIDRTSARGSRRYRLRGADAFEAVFRTGRRIDGRFLQLVAAPAARPPGRIGYVIAGKSIPRAVDRNRLRRRLRESVRAARPAIEQYDVILRVKRAVSAAEILSAAAEGAGLVGRLLAASPA